MDTITLAGPLEAKLKAVREAGFTQIMLNATDIVGHPGGESAAVAAVRESGLRVTGCATHPLTAAFAGRVADT